MARMGSDKLGGPGGEEGDSLDTSHRRGRHAGRGVGTFATGLRRGHHACEHATLDILCSSPGATPFTVQVKSVSRNNQWVLVRKEHLTGPAKDALFSVVVLVPDDLSKPCAFHIITHAEACENFARQPKTRKDGQQLVAGWEGLAWRDVAAQAGQWGKLPS